jgi:hypothetical protein
MEIGDETEWFGKGEVRAIVEEFLLRVREAEPELVGEDVFRMLGRSQD